MNKFLVAMLIVEALSCLWFVRLNFFLDKKKLEQEMDRELTNWEANRWLNAKHTLLGTWRAK